MNGMEPLSADDVKRRKRRNQNDLGSYERSSMAEEFVKEWYRLLIRSIFEFDLDSYEYGIEMLGFAKISSSAAEARRMGYLQACDTVTMNKDSVIYSAKQIALQLSEQGYRPPVKNNQITVLGRGGIAEFKVRFNMFRQGNFISEYDEVLLNQLAYVLCGGDVPDNSKVTEQYLLDLEREVFVSLIGQQKTLERIEHTLKTGKPLRN